MLALLSITVVMSAYVGVSSLILHYFAFKKGLDIVDDWESDNWDFDDDDAKNDTRNPLLKHWFHFGGGYYGTVAFVELMKIELNQLRDFVKAWPGLASYVEGLGLNTLISIMVEQYQNFVAAIIWPTYYLGKFTIFECGAFVLVTYLAFEAAKRLVKKKFANQ